MYELFGKAHAALISNPGTRLPGVDLPDIPVDVRPDVDSKDIMNKGTQGAEWLSVRSGSFWTILIILVAAYFIGKWLKNPMVKGFAIGFIALAIVLAVLKG